MGGTSPAASRTKPRLSSSPDSPGFSEGRRTTTRKDGEGSQLDRWKEEKVPARYDALGPSQGKQTHHSPPATDAEELARIDHLAYQIVGMPSRIPGVSGFPLESTRTI